MKMIDYIRKKYPENRILISSTEDENVFIITSFTPGRNGLDSIVTFACTDGKVLLIYDQTSGEVVRYDWDEDESGWKYYSWTFSYKDDFNIHIKSGNYELFYNDFKGLLG